MATSKAPLSFSRSVSSLFRSSQHLCTRCQAQQTRTVATSRRTRKALRVPADQPFNETTSTQDHIIFNPPSSAPNVYHTPLAFLPKNDPRRKLHMLTTASQQPAPAAPVPETASAQPPRTRMPPALKLRQPSKYHLTQTDIDEIRQLRAEDPRLWTRERLAEKFECSEFFVSLCAQSPAAKAERDGKIAEVKERWGRQKREAREERARRKEGWGRGD